MIGTALYASVIITLYWLTVYLGGAVNVLTGVVALSFYLALYIAEARK